MSFVQKVIPSQIIKCINIAREYPKYYLPLLEQQINSFVNEYQYRLNKTSICQTNQGKEAWIGAKKFLQAQKPIQPLFQHKGLTRAAENHAYDLEKMDQITHSGSDGATFIQRIIKYCEKSEGALVQIIGNDFNFSQRNHAQMIVLGLIIDDGVTSRGHRSSIFSQQYKYIGCGIGYLSGKIVGVINMSQTKLRQKSSIGNASTSTTNLQSSKVSKRNQHQQADREHMVSSKNQFLNDKSFSSSVSSQRSHKSQKVWTFTKVDDGKNSYNSRKNQNQKQGQQVSNKQSKVSLAQFNSKQRINQQKQNKISRKQVDLQSQIQNSNIQSQYSLNNKQYHKNSFQSMKNSKISQTGEQKNIKTFGSDISNVQKSKFSKTGNSSGFRSYEGSGFKRIKQKKEVSRVWQQGQFKYEQKSTEITFTDGTTQQFKQKKSLLIQN